MLKTCNHIYWLVKVGFIQKVSQSILQKDWASGSAPAVRPPKIFKPWLCSYLRAKTTASKLRNLFWGHKFTRRWPAWILIGSIQLSSARFSSVQFRSVQLGSDWFSSVQLGSGWLSFAEPKFYDQNYWSHNHGFAHICNLNQDELNWAAWSQGESILAKLS